MTEQLDKLLNRRVFEIIEKKNLEHKISFGKKIRVKLGIDPNRPNLHLGHAVPLMKMKDFQDAGHTAVLIIGDYTAVIGDPSEKDSTRQALTLEEVEKNAKGFLEQAYLILNSKKTEVHFQSEWYSSFKLIDFIKLASRVSVGQMLSHETFKKRLRDNRPFALHEMLYPLLQGYDSVAVKADLEIGAVEQKFNVLMGRVVQKAFGMPPQDVMLLPYLIGLDGKEKMSKSLNNFIALTDSADEMFGKIMSIPDNLLRHYFELCTNMPVQEIERTLLTKGLQNPMLAKMRLALEITRIYHEEKEANQARDNFQSKFGKTGGAIKADFSLKMRAGEYLLTDLLVKGHLASSKSEARRKIKEGAIEVDGAKITGEKVKVKIKKNSLLRLGKRFLRVE